ncbi:MAG: hypothetical protein IJS78_05425 [Clostridia bacterium]|nr:hypothetical protein [Clostridia bacterium]
MKKNDKKISDGLKALFVIVGAVVTVGAAVMVLYNIFKKYFKITIECEDEDGDCFDDFDEFDPVCSPDGCASCAKSDGDGDEEDDEEEDDEEEEEE